MSYWKERDVECLSLECSGVKKTGTYIARKTSSWNFLQKLHFWPPSKIGNRGQNGGAQNLWWHSLYRTNCTYLFIFYSSSLNLLPSCVQNDGHQRSHLRRGQCPRKKYKWEWYHYFTKKRGLGGILWFPLLERRIDQTWYFVSCRRSIQFQKLQIGNKKFRHCRQSSTYFSNRWKVLSPFEIGKEKIYAKKKGTYFFRSFSGCLGCVLKPCQYKQGIV